MELTQHGLTCFSAVTANHIVAHVSNIFRYHSTLHGISFLLSTPGGSHDIGPDGISIRISLSRAIRFMGHQHALYIPKELNNFTVGRDCKRGDLPIGVSWDKQHGKYMSRANDSKGKYLFLGLYDDPMEAHEAWFFKKLEIALEYKGLCDSIHPDLTEAFRESCCLFTGNSWQHKQ
ncbi:hypothetical protein K9J44_26080 [Enterobacter hormaechei]|nr:hypothetical protein [Enterobacter hormaechei]